MPWGLHGVKPVKARGAKGVGPGWLAAPMLLSHFLLLVFPGLGALEGYRALWPLPDNAVQELSAADEPLASLRGPAT